MKILKLYTYDYYEFEESFAVSEDRDLLLEVLDDIRKGSTCIYSDAPLEEGEHEEWAIQEKAHFSIETILYLK